MALADELNKLQELHRTGALSDEEFARSKAALLAGQALGAAAPIDVEQQTRQWAMFLHLSLLIGLIPFAGWIAGPIAAIVIWQVKKAQLPGIDVHGKNVVNWIISFIIFLFAAVALCFVFIGFPLVVALAVCYVIFPIIGGVKANNGEVWQYPLAISFVK